MVSTTRTQCRWSSSEDEILMRHVHVQERILLRSDRSRDWSTIAAKIPGRSNKDCRKRWLKVCDTIKKGEWHISEDEKLRNAVRQYGYRWVQIARHIKTRSADQCASRWRNYLDPNLKRHEWTQEEDSRLLKSYQLYGSNWKTIQILELPNRALQDLRNHHRCISKSCRAHESVYLAPYDMSANNSEDGHNSTSSPLESGQQSHPTSHTISKQNFGNMDTLTGGVLPDANSEVGTLPSSLETNRNKMVVNNTNEDIFPVRSLQDTTPDLSIILEYHFPWLSGQYLIEDKAFHDERGHTGDTVSNGPFAFDGSNMDAVDTLIYALTASSAYPNHFL